jgi:hypothetical protein
MTAEKHFAATPVAANTCGSNVFVVLQSRVTSSALEQSLGNRCAPARALPWRGHNRARENSAHERDA